MTQNAIEEAEIDLIQFAKQFLHKDNYSPSGDTNYFHTICNTYLNATEPGHILHPGLKLCAEKGLTMEVPTPEMTPRNAEETKTLLTQQKAITIWATEIKDIILARDPFRDKVFTKE